MGGDEEGLGFIWGAQFYLLGVWPCSSGNIGNTNWNCYIFFFERGHRVDLRGLGSKCDHGHCVKFPDNQ